MFRNGIYGIHSDILDSGIYSESLYTFIYIFLRNIQKYSDAHKIFPPHKMRSGNVDTGYYRYAG